MPAPVKEEKMKQFFSYIFTTLVLLAATAAFSLIYHLRIEKLDGLWLIISVAQDLVIYLPPAAALSFLWGLVFRGKNESQPPSQAVTTFFAILYILVMISATFAFQEVLVPRLYDMASYRSMLERNKLDTKVTISDTTGAKFTMKEFANLKYMDSRENIAFYMGMNLVYFEKMYNGNGSYYVKGMRFIAFTTNGRLDYILTSENAKIADNNILSVSPVYYGYGRNGDIVQVKRTDGIKKIPLEYDPDALFRLTTDYKVRTASLLDVFLYSDYIFGSRLDYYRIGNLVFNKLSYYIILILLLVLAVSFGSVYRNQRPVNKDFAQAAAFYLASFFLTVLAYDILVAFSNMIYGVLA